MNAPAPRRALERRSTLLVDWRAEDAALTCRTGQVAAFTRASTGDAATSVGTVTLPSGLPRFSMIDTDGAGGVDTLALRVDKTSGGRAVEVVAIPLLFTLPANFTVYVKHAPDWYATAGALAAKADIASLPLRYKFTGDGGAATGTIGVNTFPMAVTVTNTGAGTYRFVAASGTPWTLNGKTTVVITVIDASQYLSAKVVGLSATQVDIEIFDTLSQVGSDPSAYQITIETEP